jgi:hypothetical protein
MKKLNFMYYSHYKPFNASSIGGTIKAITKSEARSIIKRKKLKLKKMADWEKNIGQRYFYDESKREYVVFYLLNMKDIKSLM